MCAYPTGGATAWLLVALLASGAFGAPAGWWNSAWKCRRTVVAAGAAERAPGEPVCAVTFRTGGHLRDDAADKLSRLLEGERQRVSLRHRDIRSAPA